MKKLLLIPLVLLIAGCTTVPVTPTFPNRPATLEEDCDKLKKLADDAKLSDLMITITENYMRYHECKRKNQGWNEWYNEQKKIFETAGKK